MKDEGDQRAVEHLGSLVQAWADAKGIATTVRVSPTDLNGVSCALVLSDGATIGFAFLFTRGVESGDADPGIRHALSEAWAEGRLHDREIFVSSYLDEYSILDHQDPPEDPPDAERPDSPSGA